MARGHATHVDSESLNVTKNKRKLCITRRAHDLRNAFNNREAGRISHNIVCANCSSNPRGHWYNFLVYKQLWRRVPQPFLRAILTQQPTTVGYHMDNTGNTENEIQIYNKYSAHKISADASL